jgi:hypothetical protein
MRILRISSRMKCEFHLLGVEMVAKVVDPALGAVQLFGRKVEGRSIQPPPYYSRYRDRGRFLGCRRYCPKLQESSRSFLRGSA